MRPEIRAWHYSTNYAVTTLGLGARYRARSRISGFGHYPSNRYPQTVLHVRGHIFDRCGSSIRSVRSRLDMASTSHDHRGTRIAALLIAAFPTHRPISKVRSDRPDGCASSFAITISKYMPCVVSRFAVDYHECAELPSSHRPLPRSQESTIKSNQKQDFPPPATVQRSLLQAYRQHV